MVAIHPAAAVVADSAKRTLPPGDVLRLRIRHAGGVNDDRRRIAAMRHCGEDIDNMDFRDHGSLIDSMRGDNGSKAC